MARPSCSFCGKSQDEVARLIAGPAAFICNDCVELCVSILAEKPAGQVTRAPTDALAENEPAPPELSPLHILVQMPDGSVHGCESESEWTVFAQDGERYEWCVARGRIRGEVLLHVVAVREGDIGRPARGMAFPVSTKLTEEHARRIVDEMWRDKGLS